MTEPTEREAQVDSARPPAAPARQLHLTLLDVAALVVGYGLASMLVRAFWPENERPGVLDVVAIALVFAWLGLAMAGPVVLLIRRPGPIAPGEDERPEPRTWAELAWMIIGFYWIGLTILAVPARTNGGRFFDSAMLGIFPVIAGLLLWVVGPRQAWARVRPRKGERTWTHTAGILLLLTWPFAWVALILLGKTLL